MLRLVTIVCIATLFGCGRGGALQRGAAPPDAPEGNWFCQIAENAEDWSCIQDPVLARSPKPSRLPKPKRPAALAAPITTTTSSADAALEPESGEPADAEMLAEPPPPPAMDAAAEATSQTGEALAIAPVPTHVRLAYQPTEPTPILDMPADFYAVQLIAMSSRERLESYIEDNNLEGMSAARIERDGEIFFVLILGIYETRELAEEASRDIPPPLDTTQPWIRELGALQEAMHRANTMAGASTL